MQRIKRIIQAGAGTGKTKLLIDNALELINEGKVLYLTYTSNNLKSMQEDISLIKGVIPSKIVCRSWVEFLYNDLAKPYRNMVGLPKTEGLDFRQAGEIPRIRGISSDSLRYYLNSRNQIYSERLAQLCCKIDVLTDSKVFNRISKVYRTILVDEIQDLNGYDLEILKYMYNLNCNIIMVGDHRQSTYSTNNSTKYRRYRNERIFEFFNVELGINNIETLETCYRCNQELCDFANQLFDDLNLVAFKKDVIPYEDGIILLDSKEKMEEYINTYDPTILYYSRPGLRKLEGIELNINPEYLSFGDSKGLTRDRVLILPTVEMKKHALGQTYTLAPLTLAKYYVGITRAKKSVAIYVS